MFWASARQRGLRQTLITASLSVRAASQPAPPAKQLDGDPATDPQAHLAVKGREVTENLRTIARQPGAYSKDPHQGSCAVCHGQ